jgi:hypothetical protein
MDEDNHALQVWRKEFSGLFETGTEIFSLACDACFSEMGYPHLGQLSALSLTISHPSVLYCAVMLYNMFFYFFSMENFHNKNNSFIFASSH